MGTVAKALSLLGHFTQDRPEIGLSELTRASGLNKATAHRLLCELQAAGLVEQHGPDRAYRLGPSVLRLAALREAAVPMRAAVREALRALADRCGETAHMSVVQDGQPMTLAHAYSGAHATRVIMEDGETLSFHGTASGLAILAFSPPMAVDAALAPPLVRHTPQTITDAAQIRGLLARIRAEGFSESVAGYEVDVHSHAAPVFGPDGQPMGALAVAAPVSRMDAARGAMIRDAVRAAARDLTERLGGLCPPDYPARDAA